MYIRRAMAVLLLLGAGTPSLAVESGIGAYLLGSRASFAGFVPEPGSYAALDIVASKGSVEGLSLAGLPIRADTEISLKFAKLSLTQVFDTTLWGGTPAINLNIPFVMDAELSFVGQTPPINGIPFTDTTSGIGDITITGLVGWHREKLHYSAGLSVFAPTGSYKTANVDVQNRSISALNTGKNIWSFQPVFAVTHFDQETGLELSGAASAIFSTRNHATDYQNAPAVNLEAAVLQHVKSGWAFGVSGYAYKQIGDDSGSGAESTKAFLDAKSLSAQVFGAGPIVTYSGASFLGKVVSLQLKYYNEFGAKRRFESDTLWFNVSASF